SGRIVARRSLALRQVNDSVTPRGRITYHPHTHVLRSRPWLLTRRSSGRAGYLRYFPGRLRGRAAHLCVRRPPSMDRPKLLEDPEARATRLKELQRSHIAPLTRFVEDLRAEAGPGAAIPY